MVQVRHAVAWEGSLCSYASLKCDGVGLNGVQLRNVRDARPFHRGARDGHCRGLPYCHRDAWAGGGLAIRLASPAATAEPQGSDRLRSGRGRCEGGRR